MVKQLNSILDKVLEKINPSKEELEDIENSLKSFLEDLAGGVKKSGVDAEIFIGGSFAKKTVIRKNKYDVDIFLRFNKKYEDLELSKMTEKILEGVSSVSKVHGSRDYFQIEITPSLFFEVVPVKKISGPKQAENITDMSYSHVNYIKKKIKSKKILDDIKIAKAFCHAHHCYGAESYIQGFSGYALELLVYHYRGFEKFLKAIVKMKNEKIVIDIEKDYKNRAEVLMDVNSSKLHSPIILIDPTCKQRNALAALSQETLNKFKKDCGSFLKNPLESAFEEKKTDLEQIQKDVEKNKYEFILIEARTDKQEGDVAGSKLLKFYKHFSEEISKFFKIKNCGFNYNNKKSARYFFVVKSKGEILIEGPYVKDKKNLKAFEKVHHDYFTKKGKIYSKEEINFSLKEFFEKWKKKNAGKVKEMGVTEIILV